MALLKCKECKHVMSNKAKLCPNCGAKNHKRIGILGSTFIIIVFLIMIGQFSGSYQTTSTTLDSERDKKFQHDVVILKALKESFNNPTSFELVNAFRLDDGTLCIKVRGSNSFNAIITKFLAISSTGHEMNFENACSGKSGEDITYIKQAL